MLKDGDLDPQTYLGREYWFKGTDDGWPEELDVVEPDHRVEIAQDMIDAVLTSHRYVTEQAALIGGEIHSEIRVPISHITGEEGAHGTSDVIITAGDLIWTLDLKAGRKRVTAYDVIEPAGEDIITGEPTPEKVRPNLQATLYTLGAMKALEPRTFKVVRMTILQPFLNSVSEWSGTVSEVEAVGAWLSQKAEETRTNPKFEPSYSNCFFCRASGKCEAQTQAVMQAALVGFEDGEPEPRPVEPMKLGQAYSLVPLIRSWCDAVEKRVEAAIWDGECVARDDGVAYKLVEGRKGAREWDDDTAVEDYLKANARLGDKAYKPRKIISPADAEKLAKAKKGEKPLIGPTQWKRLAQHITQADGKPVVVPETDPRPALPTKADGFEEVTAAETLVDSDLF